LGALLGRWRGPEPLFNEEFRKVLVGRVSHRFGRIILVYIACVPHQLVAPKTNTPWLIMPSGSEHRHDTLKIRTGSRNLEVLLDLMYNTLWCIYVTAVAYFKCIPRNTTNAL
jgi:hypothetical protein